MPTIASTRVGYVLVCSAALLGMLYLQKKTSALSAREEEEEDNNNGSNDTLKSTDTDHVIGPFPWEPKLSKRSFTATSPSRRRPRRQANVITLHQNQELDFSASMTFANGGLAGAQLSMLCPVMATEYLYLSLN